jgi:succinate dehydrogenase / fumarate reductase iron-sulfur subunit
MNSTEYAFRIFRFDPSRDEEPIYRTYVLNVPQGMTVLEALLRIQAEQDGSLSFRYACRGAVCGSCAMMINGREELACRTQVQGLLERTRTRYQGPDREEIAERADDRTILVEPLRNLKVVKDLVVDMDPFFDKFKAVEPWLQTQVPHPERERLVEPEDWVEAEPYTNCILCACCHSGCPVEEEDPQYLGPAALAQHYRFLADIRDEADDERLALVDGEHGVKGCDFVWNCVEICSKGVPPTKGIAKTRARITRKDKKARQEGTADARGDRGV